MKKIFTICQLLKIVFGSYAQTPDLNLSFENVDTFRIENVDTFFLEAKGWRTRVNGGYAIPVKDAFEGKYAIQIFTNYVNLPDYLKLGFNDKEEPKGIPFKEKIKKLKGFYKYEYGDNCGGRDSAEVYIYVKKFNVQTNKSDTIGRGQIYLGPTSVYKSFEVPIIYNRSIPSDTLCIEFFSQWFDRTVKCTIPNNRYFTIDNLSLEYSTTSLLETLKSPITLHPNPTNNSIRITWGENAVSDVILKDILGRVLQKKAVNTEGVEFDLSTLPTGLYFVEFNQNGQHLATRKVVKQ